MILHSHGVGVVLGHWLLILIKSQAVGPVQGCLQKLEGILRVLLDALLDQL